MDRRDIARYMVWRHVLSWILAFMVLLAVFFLGTGQAFNWMIVLTFGFALLVVTPVLYLLARRVSERRG
jgi:hypothetical protein